MLPNPESLKTDRIPMLTEMLELINQNLVLYNKKKSNSVLTEEQMELVNDQLIVLCNKKSRVERLLSDQKPLNKKVTLCYADVIPELCLIRLVHYLPTEDSRNLYLALSTETQPQVEYIFIKKLQQTLSTRHAWDKTTDCGVHQVDQVDQEYCKLPNCMRCYLNTKYECNSCKQPTLIPKMNCENMVATSYGTMCRCDELYKCECGNKYSLDMRNQVIRYLDRRCPCHFQYVGCEKCVRECLWCANVGCVKDEHYRINPDPYAANSTADWPDCEDCNHQHCCAVRIMPKDGDDVTVEEWNYFTCPRWEPIAREKN